MTKSNTTTPSPSERLEMLRQAEKIVGQQRNLEYGEPVQNMKRTANMLQAYFGDRIETAIKPEDVAAIGVIIKLCRRAHNPDHLDSWVDIAGYSSIGYEAVKKASYSAGLRQSFNEV